MSTENTTTDITNEYVQVYPRTLQETEKLSKEEIEEKRKELKEKAITLIDNTLNFFMENCRENISIEHINELNVLIYNCLIYIDTTSAQLAESTKEISTKCDAENITNDWVKAIQDLGLWKRNNDFIEQHPIIDIFSSIKYLREIKTYIKDEMYIKFIK